MMNLRSNHDRLGLSAQWRFTFLLIVLLLFFLVLPFFERTVIAFAAMEVVIVALMAAGIYAVADDRRAMLFGLLLAALATSARWLQHFFPNAAITMAWLGFGIGFVLFTALQMLLHLLRGKRVTLDTISCSLCVYLLLAVAWAFGFILLEALIPGSFNFSDQVDITSKQLLLEMLYYSTVTLTTLGYGDIAPVTVEAKGLAAIEAVVGQIYLTVLVARLVGLHIAQSPGSN